MPGFDDLAPDQKAVLQLLLKQGKSYDDIAGLLRLERSSVRERGLDALDAIGADVPGTVGELSAERQDELADHLLLQQTASQRAATRDFLQGSAPGRAWARGVAAELRPIGGDALPDIPEEPAEVAEAFDALDERTAARERAKQSSRLGGILVLLAVGAVVALAILVIVRGGGDDKPATTADVPAATTGATGAGAEGAALPQQQVNFRPPNGSKSKALGFGIITKGGLALQAEGLPASDLYKVWLYNSRADVLPLGFAFYDRKTKRLAGAVEQLPAAASRYAAIIVTREKAKDSARLGTIVLQGPLKRG